ncbi:unnamed protein product [Brugia timori]|uniref:BTB domain-containing protein n=1 Tax=Brugia timori TaxID=42155 RepID=A0A3P7SCX7_9BILA|nr:unnamed protein product [Brugia timori]
MKGALFFGFNYFYENRPHAITSGIFLFDSEYHGLIRPVYFYSTLMKRSIIEVASADVTRDGQIIIVDYKGDVYEGNLANYTLCLDPYFCNSNDNSSWDTTDHIIKVKVNRLRGILSAKSAFLTPDGRNMVLNLVEIDPRSVLRCIGNVSQVQIFHRKLVNVSSSVTDASGFSWRESRIVEMTNLNKIFLQFPSDSIAVIICMDENGDELGRYETSLEMLKHESDVCSSYFERWAGNQNNEIRITGKPELMEMFLSFCCDHCLRSNLSMQELMELLVFADKLICKSFFNAVMKELFRPPFEMSNLRDLFALARYLSSMELYQSLSVLCAAMFPTLLENGFVNELLLDEIAYIEDAFRSHALQNIAHTVDMFESEIKKLVVPKQTVRNIIVDVMAVLKEPMDMKSLINFCKTIKINSLPKKRRKHMGSSRSRTVDTEAVKSCGLQDSSINEKNDGCGVQMPNILNKTAFKPIDIKKKYPSLPDIQIAIATNEVCENWLARLSLACLELQFGKLFELVASVSSKYIPQVFCETDMLGGTRKTYAFASVSGAVTEREGKTVKIKQKEKKCPHISPTSTSENTCELQQRISYSWHLDESVICGNSFAQIMEDERARQLETMRQARCRLSDINMEEQAMAELTAQYEGEATMQGVSITVSTEREVEKVNDPLWAARSCFVLFVRISLKGIFTHEHMHVNRGSET